VSYDPADHSRASSSTWHDKFSTLIALRLLKVGRVLRTAFRVAASSSYLVTAVRNNLRALKKVQIILETALVLFIAFSHIALLIALSIFFFSVMGMNLFGRIPPIGESLNEDWNFSDFLSSMSTLLRISGGEDWHLIYADIVYLDCRPELRFRNPEACPEASTFAFFIAFFITVVYVLLNLFIATVIDVFTSVFEQEYSDMAIEHIYDFTAEWMRICKFHDSAVEDARNSSVSVREFKHLLGTLSRPIGVVPSGEESRENEGATSDAERWHIEALMRVDSVIEDDWLGPTRQRQLAAHKEAAILNKCDELNLTAVDGRLEFGTTLRLCLRYSAVKLNPYYVHKRDKMKERKFKHRKQMIRALGKVSLSYKRNKTQGGAGGGPLPQQPDAA